MAEPFTLATPGAPPPDPGRPHPTPSRCDTLRLRRVASGCGGAARRPGLESPHPAPSRNPPGVVVGLRPGGRFLGLRPRPRSRLKGARPQTPDGLECPVRASTDPPGARGCDTCGSAAWARPVALGALQGRGELRDQPRTTRSRKPSAQVAPPALEERGPGGSAPGTDLSPLPPGGSRGRGGVGDQLSAERIASRYARAAARNAASGSTPAASASSPAPAGDSPRPPRREAEPRGPRS